MGSGDLQCFVNTPAGEKLVKTVHPGEVPAGVLPWIALYVFSCVLVCVLVVFRVSRPRLPEVIRVARTCSPHAILIGA